MAIPRRFTGHSSVESNAHQEPAVTQAEFAHPPANDIAKRVKLEGTGAAWCRWFALGLLIVIYVFNLLDRQLLIVLAPYVKADLKISDTQLGLLYGTAFALFYGLFGVPLAKLSDGWSRVKILAWSLSFWSVMTMLSGISTNFVQLTLARVGVGIGEASASPAATSLLADYFPKRQRATVLGIYSTGTYIGAGISLILGGAIVAAWKHAFIGPASAPLGLAGWQAAFLCIGLPGPLLAAITVLTLREPVRGTLEGIRQAESPTPFTSAMKEAASMLPPWSILSIGVNGGSKRDVYSNIMWLVGILASIAVLTRITNSLLTSTHNHAIFSLLGFGITSNLVQWTAVGIGVYAAISWLQSMRLRDPVGHTLIAASPAFLALAVGSGFVGIGIYSANAFVFRYATQYLAFVPENGIRLGIISAVVGTVGMILGGFLGDAAKRRHPAGRLYSVIVLYALFSAGTLAEFLTNNLAAFYAGYAASTLFLSMCSGSILATAQDLVLPRMRGAAFATVALGTNIIGLGLGPYLVGLISDITGNLRWGILSVLFSLPGVFITFRLAARYLPSAEFSLLARARAAGESI